MHIISCPDNYSLVDQAYQWLRRSVEANEITSFYIPAGSTPTALYQKLEQENPDFMNGLKLIQIDDLLEGAKKELFKHYFQQQLPSYQKQISYIGSHPEQAEGAILGLGLNGHVAFHEPGIPKSFSFGTVELSGKTKESLGLEPETKGQSYGIGSFLNCKKILMIVSGTGKQSAFEKMLRNDQSIPAALLNQHPDFTVIYNSQDVQPPTNFS